MTQKMTGTLNPRRERLTRRQTATILMSELLSAGYDIQGRPVDELAQELQTEQETVWERTITLLPEAA